MNDRRTPPAPRSIFELADLIDETGGVIPALHTDPDISALPQWARDLWTELDSLQTALDEAANRLRTELDEAMRATRPDLPAGWAVWTGDGRLIGCASSDPRHRDGWDAVSSDPADAAGMQRNGCLLDPLSGDEFDLLCAEHGFDGPGARDRFLDTRAQHAQT